MIVQCDVEDEQPSNAAFECLDEPLADGAMGRMREIREACGTVREVHHEAIGEVHAEAFGRDVGAALEVREGDAGNFREPSDLLEEN